MPEPLSQSDRSPEELLADVIEALDWADAPKSDEHVDTLQRRVGRTGGYSPGGRVRALYSRERQEANRQRSRADELALRLADVQAILSWIPYDDDGEPRGNLMDGGFLSKVRDAITDFVCNELGSAVIALDLTEHVKLGARGAVDA